MKTWIWTAGAAIALLAAGAAITQAENDSPMVIVKKPFDPQGKKSKSGSGGILYHGGGVMLGTVPVYVIYYGTFTVATTQPIINAFLGGLSGTSQYRVNTTYDDSSNGTGTFISGHLSFSVPSSVFQDSGASQGTSIGTSTVPKIVQYALNPSTPLHLPAISDAVYIVITAPDIKVSGFCTSYCAYHTSSAAIASINGTPIPIRYALVPDPSQRCTRCDGNFAMGETTTPTGDAGADEMVDSIMHELSESVTDPDGKSWFTSNGEEDGDLCNFVYGSNLPTVNGASYNATWEGYNYLIQEIWRNNPNPALQVCAVSPQ